MEAHPGKPLELDQLSAIGTAKPREPLHLYTRAVEEALVQLQPAKHGLFLQSNYSELGVYDHYSVLTPSPSATTMLASTTCRSLSHGS